MSVLRTVVFPALRLLVWAVIAVSLAWLAFGRPDAGSDPVATPSFEPATPEVAVLRGTVSNTITLTGTVTAAPAEPVKATAAGRVSRVRVEVGDPVRKGAPLIDVVTSPPPADPAAPPPPQKTTTVRATSAGTVTTLDVLVDQEVAVGVPVASVTPDTRTVTAPLTQDQQFRLLEPPSTAQVSVPGGPAPFTCDDVRIGQPTAAAPAPDPNAGQYGPYGPTAPTGPPTGSVSCTVPPAATVFAGMSASVELTAGTAADVLVLPVTAVQGSVGNGTVWVLGTDGTSTERGVTLGLTDGRQVEIRGGLAEGDRVLEFVPNSDVLQPGPYGPMYGGPGG